MTAEKITSLQLHLKFPPEQIVEVQVLRDVGCGMYPCYYIKTGGMLKTATSVTALILDSGGCEFNPHFQPEGSDLKRALKKFYFRTRPGSKHVLNLLNHGWINRKFLDERHWYLTWDTIDKRIKKLRPFETVTPWESSMNFRPTCTITDMNVLVEKTAVHMTDFIHNIETDFPEHDHIVMTSGRDSQPINLVPKLNYLKWHIFTSDPMRPIVKKWVEENNLQPDRVNRVFEYDGGMDETMEDTKRKIICGDLFSDIRHLRWAVTLKKLAALFDYKCIFWMGSMGDKIYQHNREWQQQNGRYFFDCHVNQASAWQGNGHQIYKNFVGCPFLSPYHSEQIWEELYQHLDPAALSRATQKKDLRYDLGDRLFGKPVEWICENLQPPPFEYRYDKIDPYRTYVDYIRDGLSRVNNVEQPPLCICGKCNYCGI